MCVLEGVAAAEDPAPGTGGDALRAIETNPALVTSSALAIDGIAVRGATPAEGRILVDGFEIPFLYHFGFRTVGLTTRPGVLVPTGTPRERGRATSSVLELDTQPLPSPPGLRTSYDLSPFE